MRRTDYLVMALGCVVVFPLLAKGEFVDLPSEVPAELEGPCRTPLELQYQEIKRDWVELEPQVKIHEARCGGIVDPDDHPLNAYCAGSDRKLTPKINAYYDKWVPFEETIKYIQERLPEIVSKRIELTKEIRIKEAKIEVLEAKSARATEEMNKAFGRLTGARERIDEWVHMTRETQKKVLRDAFLNVMDGALGHIKKPKKMAEKRTLDRLEEMTELYKKHGGYPLIKKELARTARQLDDIQTDLDVIEFIETIKKGLGTMNLSDIDLNNQYELFVGLLDVIEMVVPSPQVKLVINAGKLGGNYLYAVGQPFILDQAVGLESEHMAQHLRAMETHRKRRDRFERERIQLVNKKKQLEQQRAELPTGCLELF